MEDDPPGCTKFWFWSLLWVTSGRYLFFKRPIPGIRWFTIPPHCPTNKKINLSHQRIQADYRFWLQKNRLSTYLIGAWEGNSAIEWPYPLGTNEFMICPNSGPGAIFLVALGSSFSFLCRFAIRGVTEICLVFGLILTGRASRPFVNTAQQYDKCCGHPVHL